MLAAVLAVLSVGWAGLSGLLPQPARGIAIGVFVACVVVAVVFAVNAQSKRLADEWRRGEGDE
jgi:hypothetical protein